MSEKNTTLITSATAGIGHGVVRRFLDGGRRMIAIDPAAVALAEVVSSSAWPDRTKKLADEVGSRPPQATVPEAGSRRVPRADGYALAPELVRMVVASASASPGIVLRFVDDEGQVEEISLGEFVAQVRRTTARLAASGLVPGDLVAIRGQGASLPTSMAIAACTLGGFVATPLVSLLGDGDVDGILSLSDAKALLAEPVVRGRDLSAHLARIRAERPAIVTAGIGGLDRDEFRLPPPSEHRVDWSARSDRSPAFVQFSSGTTGVPKGVVHSCGTLLAEVYDFADQLDLLQDGHLLQPFPLGHIGGIAGLFIALALGRETTMLASWNAAIAIDVIDRYRVTGMGSTPYFARTLFEERARRGHGLESLRAMESGGGYVGRDLVYRAAEFGVPLSRGYGSTEHPTATTHHSWDPLEVRAESDGSPTNGTRIRIVAPDGRDVPAGEEGEVLLSGPEQLIGYLSGDRSAFVDDVWFRTGDIGRLDADGHLTITGRLKEIIIRGGENISAGEVEEILTSHPSVAEAAVAGVPDPKFGERAHAFLVLVPGAAPVDVEEVRRYFDRREVAKFKTPEYVTTVDRLPRNTLGKVQKHVLIAAYAESQEVTGPTAVS